MPVIYIPGKGNIKFPDNMSNLEIESAIKKMNLSFPSNDTNPQQPVTPPVTQQTNVVPVNKPQPKSKTPIIQGDQTDIKMEEMGVVDTSAQRKNIESLPDKPLNIGARNFEAERQSLNDEYNKKINALGARPFNDPEVQKLVEEKKQKLKSLNSSQLIKSPEVRGKISEINNQLNEKDALIAKAKNKAIDEEWKEMDDRGLSVLYGGSIKDLIDIGMIKLSGTAETKKLENEKKAIVDRKNKIENTGVDPLDKISIKSAEDVIKYGLINDVSIYSNVKNAKKFKDFKDTETFFSYENMEKAGANFLNYFKKSETKGLQSDKLAKNAFDNSLNKLALQKESKFNNEFKNLIAKGYSKDDIYDASEALINVDPNNPTAVQNAVLNLSKERNEDFNKTYKMIQSLKDDSDYKKILDWDLKNNLSGLYNDNSKKYAIGQVSKIVAENDKNFAGINKRKNEGKRDNYFKDKLSLENEDSSFKSLIKETLASAILSGEYLGEYTASLAGNVLSATGSNSEGTFNKLYATDVYDMLHPDDSQSNLNYYSKDKFFQIPDKNGKPMNVRLDEQGNIMDVYSEEFDAPIRNKELIKEIDKVYQANKEAYLKQSKDIWNTEHGKKLVGKNLTWEVWKGLLEEIPTTALEIATGRLAQTPLRWMGKAITRGATTSLAAEQRLAKFADTYNKITENAITMASAGTEIYGDVYKGYLESGGDEKTAALVTTSALAASSLLTSSLDKRFIRMGSGAAQRNLNAEVVRDLPNIIRSIDNSLVNIADLSLREKWRNKEIRNAVFSSYLNKATKMMGEIAKEGGQEAIEETLVEPIVEKLSNIALSKLYGNEAYNTQTLNDMGFLDPQTALVAGLTGGVMSFGGQLMSSNGKSSVKDVDYLRAAIEDEDKFNTMLNLSVANGHLTQEQKDSVQKDFGQIRDSYNSKQGKFRLDSELAKSLNFTNPALAAFFDVEGLDYRTLTDTENSQNVDDLILHAAHADVKSEKVKESLIAKGVKYDEKTDKFTMPTGDTEADKKTAVSIRDYQMMKASNKKLDNIVQTFTSENEDVQKKFIEEFENLGMEASDIFQYESKQNGKTSLASFFENPLNEAKESIISKLIKQKQLAKKEKELSLLEDGDTKKDSLKTEISTLKSEIKSHESDITDIKKLYQKGSTEAHKEYNSIFSSLVNLNNDIISRKNELIKDNDNTNELEELESTYKEKLKELRSKAGAINKKYGNGLIKEAEELNEKFDMFGKYLEGMKQTRSKYADYRNKRSDNTATFKDLIENMDFNPQSLKPASEIEVNSKEEINKLLEDDEVLFRIAIALNEKTTTNVKDFKRLAKKYLHARLREKGKKLKEQVVEEILPNAETEQDVVEVIDTVNTLDKIERDSILESVESNFEKIEKGVNLATISVDLSLPTDKEVAKVALLQTLAFNTDMSVEDIVTLMMAKYNITTPEEINKVVENIESARRLKENSKFQTLNGLFKVSDANKNLAPLILINNENKTISVIFFTDDTGNISENDESVIKDIVKGLEESVQGEYSVVPVLGMSENYDFKGSRYEITETEVVTEEEVVLDENTAEEIESQDVEDENPALRDIESTAKALEGNLKNIPLSFDYDANSPSEVSEAYHKAKADGSDPGLVKAVESLLTKEGSKQITSQQIEEPIQEPLQEDSIDNVEETIKPEVIENLTDFDVVDGFNYAKVSVSKNEDSDTYDISITGLNFKKQSGLTLEEVSKIFEKNGWNMLGIQQIKDTPTYYILQNNKGESVKSNFSTIYDKLGLNSLEPEVNPNNIKGVSKLEGQEVELRLITSDDYNDKISDDELVEKGSIGVYKGDTLIALVSTNAKVRKGLKLKNRKLVNNKFKIKNVKTNSTFVNIEPISVSDFLKGLPSDVKRSMIYVGEEKGVKVFKDKEGKVITGEGLTIGSNMSLGQTFLVLTYSNKKALVKINNPKLDSVLDSGQKDRLEDLIKTLSFNNKNATGRELLEQLVANLNSESGSYIDIGNLVGDSIDLGEDPRNRASSVRSRFAKFDNEAFKNKSVEEKADIINKFLLNRIISLKNIESTVYNKQAEINVAPNGGTFYADNALVLEKVEDTLESDSVDNTDNSEPNFELWVEDDICLN
jgi:hypothetical protein